MTTSGALVGVMAAVGALLIWYSGPRARLLRLAWDVRWARRRAAWLRQAGLRRLSPWRLLAVQVVAGLGAGLVLLAATGSGTVAACYAAFGFLAPAALVNRRVRYRREELRDAWPDAIGTLASAARAGTGLPEALSALASTGPAPLRPVLARFTAEQRVSGGLGAALDRLRDDLADPVADRICEALRMARALTGADLDRYLRTLGSFLREDDRVRAATAARQAAMATAARVALAGPWLVLLARSAEPRTVAASDTPSGRLLLVAGAMATVLAYHLLPPRAERRVLR